MKKRAIACFVLAVTLTGCLKINNSKPTSSPEIYDFGFTANPENSFQLPPGIALDGVTAAQALNNTRIRYRLAYENKERVYTYSQSRWAATPRELLAQKLRPLTGVARNQACMLKLQLEVFDQVFDSPNVSHGVVVLNASLLDKHNRAVLAAHQITARSPAHSQDAKGGVAALNDASTHALGDTLAWANAAKPDICRAP